MLSFFRKYHKWLGLFFSVFLVFYSLSGIILNHRDLLSGVDVNRKVMPDRYTYNNWNMGALRASEIIASDSILMYGNMGVYLANDSLENLRDYTQGLAAGMDNKKVYSIYKSTRGNLYMGTLKGAFYRDFSANQWVKIILETEDERIVDITEKDGQIVFLGRSFIFISKDKPEKLLFEKILPKNPDYYDDKIGLFKTTWLIHSGEIYGIIGKLLVDLVGVIFILLSLGGIAYFFMPKKMKKDYKDGKTIKKFKGFHKWNLRWHNRLGYWSIVFLLITTITGIFLRPPGLIAIADAKVGKIPFTKIDNPSAWFDKLRAIHYDSINQEYIMLTDEYAYAVDNDFKEKPKLFETQPPISIMGVNVFKQIETDTYLVGSFAGLFLWKPNEAYIYNYQYRKDYVKAETSGPSIQNSSITGCVQNAKGQGFYIDYDSGIHSINQGITLPKMPQIIRQSPISIWNLGLEVHTGRFFSFLLGGLYILIVPIVGLAAIFILISGFIVWWKKFR